MTSTALDPARRARLMRSAGVASVSVAILLIVLNNLTPTVLAAL